MFTPNPNFSSGSKSSSSSSSSSIMSKATALLGKPVGISLRNGQGVSGVLCSMSGGQIYVMQYLYAKQFATFHYSLQDIADILPYPSCS